MPGDLVFPSKVTLKWVLGHLRATNSGSKFLAN
jgi:hypothetical protein